MSEHGHEGGGGAKAESGGGGAEKLEAKDFLFLPFLAAKFMRAGIASKKAMSEFLKGMAEPLVVLSEGVIDGIFFKAKGGGGGHH